MKAGDGVSAVRWTAVCKPTEPADETEGTQNTESTANRGFEGSPLKKSPKCAQRILYKYV